MMRPRRERSGSRRVSRVVAGLLSAVAVAFMLVAPLLAHEPVEAGFFEHYRAFAERADPIVPGWVPLPAFRRADRAKQLLWKQLQDVLEARRLPARDA
jgi:hypothetical protein